MSNLDHNPARGPREQAPRIGVRALLSARGGAQSARPQVALVLPREGGAPERQVRLSLEEASELAARLVALAALARYDAAVHAALARVDVDDAAQEALLGVLLGARAQMQEPS